MKPFLNSLFKRHATKILLHTALLSTCFALTSCSEPVDDVKDQPQKKGTSTTDIAIDKSDTTENTTELDSNANPSSNDESESDVVDADDGHADEANGIHDTGNNDSPENTSSLTGIPADETAQDVDQVQEPQDPQDEADKPLNIALQDRVTLLDETFPYDENQPAIGHWHGNIRTAAGTAAVSANIQPAEQSDDEAEIDDTTIDPGQSLDDNPWHVVVTVAPGNRPHQIARDVKIDGKNITFNFPLDPPEAGQLEFTGTVSEDGQRLSGEVKWPEVLPQPGTFELARSPLPMTLPKPMAYGGKLEIDEGIFFDITLLLAETPDGNWVGHIDIPSQSIAAWPLDSVQKDGEQFIIHMGGASAAVYRGVMTDEGTFEGIYTQLEGQENEINLDFTFDRIDDYQIPEFEPVQNLGYEFERRDVTFRHSDDIVLAGTLTMPLTVNKLLPAAVLISAHGPHERDGNIFGHKTLEVMADSLARQGIATLRFDDRGRGQSSGKFQDATIHDFAEDALAAYSFLRAIEGLEPTQVGFIGHEEGGSVAAIAASQAENPGFVVLLGAAGVTGRELEIARTKKQMELLPNADPALKEALIKTQQETYDAFLSDAADEEVTAKMLAQLEAQSALIESAGGGKQAVSERSARAKVGAMKQPWARAYLTFDPAERLATLDCPVIAMWGSLDLHSPPEVNVEPIKAAFADKAPDQVTALVYNGLNHLFQPAQTGVASEYRKINMSMHPQVMQTIAQWIQDQTDQ